MTALAIALALFAQAPEGAAPTAETPAAEERLPAGAPRDDYQFVAWCYGALRGYLDMHDEMMPEVTRIESQFRKPGTKLEDDLKVYADMQKTGKTQLKTFQAALTAAEKASVRPINMLGANAVRQGRQIWNAGPDVTKARKAQEWMSWSLPARCETVSASLEARAKLMGATFKVNEESAPPAEAAPAPEPAPADAPRPETPPAPPNPTR
ncbi:hypothetical protein [Phenylobacterium sp.]|uniref:hypothetical protein n=1 Tax=Phenylobacterium sp. TaxID=1871053 RepID=UPI0025FBFFAB|nr:hypothetical protein [Phenylobacterium sp.]